jgi:hypothetical protein
MASPTADWAAALDRMTNALHRALADLDRYQTEWAGVTDTPAAAARPELLLTMLERRLAQWDTRLAAAGGLTDAVEAELRDREVVVGHWRDVFGRWQELIQRGVEASDASDTSG